jgi:hypothetical protein
VTFDNADDDNSPATDAASNGQEPPPFGEPEIVNGDDGSVLQGDSGGSAATAGSKPLTGFLLLLLLATLGPLVQLWIRPPAALGDDAAPELFSSARAARSLEWIAAEPRPAGSQRHAEVRERLIRELGELGLEVDLQEGSKDGGRGGQEIPLVNVIARLAGEPGEADSGQADTLLLVVHYDSVSPAQGAGDDGSGVAAVLETLRALGTDGPRRNDLIVLFSDGEEAGLLGAKLFVELGHPWFEGVSAVMNFEARGVGGPALLFQVGPRSGGLVKRFAALAPHPFGTSLAPAVFEKMPNDTDFTVFLGAGKPGLNFAFVGGGLAYHGPGDRPEVLDLGSLQHQGEGMLTLARAFADGGAGDFLDEVDQEFLLLPGVQLIYPVSLSMPITLGLALGFLAFVLFRGSGPGTESRAGILRTLLGAVASVLFAGLAGAAVFYGSAGVYAATAWCLDVVGQSPEPVSGSNLLAGEWLSCAAWVGGLGVLLLLVGCVGRGEDRVAARRRLDALGSGALVPLAIGAGALALLVPGAGHVGLLTVVGSGACLWWTSPRRIPQHTGPSTGQRDPNSARLAGVVGLVSWLPAGLVLLPLIGLLVQVGSVVSEQERLLAAAAAGLALLSTLPLLAVVGARRERLGSLLIGLGTVLLVLWSLADMAVRIS